MIIFCHMCPFCFIALILLNNKASHASHFREFRNLRARPVLLEAVRILPLLQAAPETGGNRRIRPDLRGGSRIARPRWRPRKIDTMFWGGGTPSSLSEGDIERLAEALGRFRPSLEWTVEVSPSSATRGKLETLRRIGATRISLGVQSFDEGVLRSLGRAHTLKETLKAIDAVAEAGFENFR